MPVFGSGLSARAVYASKNEAASGSKVHTSPKMGRSSKNEKKRKLKQLDEFEDSNATEISPTKKNMHLPSKKSKSDIHEKGVVLQNGNNGDSSIKKKKKIKNLDVSINDSSSSSNTWTMNPMSPDHIQALNKESSRTDGLEAFQFVINPTEKHTFFSNYWEKKPLLIKRGNSEYYKGVFSTHDFDKILKDHNIQFTKNLDVTSYTDGKRETHNPVGRALGPVVWDYYNNGCSLRLLNPQTFHRPVWRLLSSLQEFFGSFCGANIYLTPPGTQGFAPHWDDIEAFILQLEGQKRWRVYKPRTPEEQLPRKSSDNLSQEEVEDPLIDVTLEPGDLLYFPRGYIHQGNTVGDKHSLHITLSTYQKTSWADFLEKLLPEALESASANDVEFRKGLPPNYLDYLGIAHSDVNTEERVAFLNQAKKLLSKLLDHAPIDSAVDQMGKQFIHNSLPPILSADEQKCSVLNGGDRWSKKKMKPINRVELEPETYVRLIKGNCIRIVMEDNIIKVFYTLENSREYQEYEAQFIELETEHAPAVEALIHAYPFYLKIEDLPLDTLEDKMVLANGLWEKGLILTDQPLLPHYD